MNEVVVTYVVVATQQGITFQVVFSTSRLEGRCFDFIPEKGHTCFIIP